MDNVPVKPGSLSINNPHRHQQLPEVPRGVFGRVNQQTNNGRGQLRPSNQPCIRQRLVIGPAKLGKAPVHLLLEPPTAEEDRGTLRTHFANLLRHLHQHVGDLLSGRDGALLRINFYDVVQQLILRELGFG